MKNNIILGIDLGTTYSAVAYVDENGTPKIIPNQDDANMTPSVVYFEKNGNIIVGQEAKDETELEPNKVVSFVKREIGKDKNEVRKEENYGEPLPYEFNGKIYSPEEISALILKKLKEDAQEYLGANITDAIITVPAYFNNFERNATIKAGELAGLNVLQVINEPTAAAISYGITNSKIAQKIFVFDLGGGTFDVTIIGANNGELRIIATDGDHRLGGKDWDDKIIEYVSNEFVNQFGEDPRDDKDSLGDLRIRAEIAKKSLSLKEKSRIIVRTKSHSLKVELNRQQFNEMSEDLMNRVEGLCDLVLNEANLSWKKIDTIILAGGSTRMPMIQELLKKISNKEIRTDLVNPDECVALGSAIKGEMTKKPLNRIGGVENGQKKNWGIRSIVDVASHSLGFVTLKNGKLHNNIMIAKNSSIPCEKRKADFTTSHDNQTSLEVLILQGESTNPSNCTLLNGYEFYQIPPSQKGNARIEVAFKYNLSGVVEVEAFCNSLKLPYRKIENPSLPILDDVKHEPLSVIIAIDLSGSMSGSPLEEAKNAAIKFVNKLSNSNASIALMPFADTVMVNQEFTQNMSQLEKSINAWRIGLVGGANSAEPFNDCLNLLKYENGKRIIIVLTDGVWSYQDKAISNARKCAEDNIEIRAIGFGGADIEFLKAIATTSSDYHFTASGAELERTFLNIATELSTNKIK